MNNAWVLLTATLPTSPSGLRVRVWRALKATGAGTLREGAYLLPAHAGTIDDFRALAAVIREAAAEAHLLELDARNAAQEREFRALFDRTEAHAEFLERVRAERARVKRSAESALRKALRDLDAQWQALLRTDFFPGRAASRGADALTGLRRAIDARLSPGEPVAAPGSLALLDRADHQGRTWATRRRPWIDRLATAWLVQRFVDDRPTFLWLATPADCPASALGFDFDGATFTHVGERVTFEVVAERFGVDADPAVARLGRLVHGIDVGGVSSDEAPGLEAVVRGLLALHPDDDALLRAALPVFDALHAVFGMPDGS